MNEYDALIELLRAAETIVIPLVLLALMWRERDKDYREERADRKQLQSRLEDCLRGKATSDSTQEDSVKGD